MSLLSYLARLLGWLRAGYAPGGTASRYIPLIALMPSPSTQIEDPPDAAGQSALLPATHPPGGARPRRKWSRRHLLLQPAEWRYAGGSCPAPSLIDPLRYQGLVSPGLPAQLCGTPGQRLVELALGRPLEYPGYLGQQV